MEQIAGKSIEHLDKREMEGSYAVTSARAREEIIAMIPKGTTVYRCGPMRPVSMDLWQGMAKIPKEGYPKNFPPFSLLWRR